MQTVTVEQALKEISPNWEKKFSRDEVVSGLSVFNDMFTELVTNNEPGYLEPYGDWPLLKEKFGAWRLKELTIFSGDTGHGKTLWAVNNLYHLVNSDVPTFTLSLEMGPEAILNKFFRMHCAAKLDKKNAIDNHSRFTDWLAKHQFYLFAGQDYLDFNKCKILMAWAALKKGCKFIVLDHFEMVLGGVREATEISKMVASIRGLAYKLNCHILAIVHPSKRSTDDSKERSIEMNDIKGSSGFKQFADNVFSIFFDKKDKVTTLTLHKIRSDEYGRFMGDKIKYILGTQTLFFREEIP